MAAASEIAGTVFAFNMNGEMLEKSFDGLTDEEWKRQPCEASNSLLWVVGHIVWARSRALGLLGAPVTREWMALFERGRKADGPGAHPEPEEIVAAWKEVKESLNSTLDRATPELLAGASPQRLPSFDGKLTGALSFFAMHEAGHVGQACYLRKWLGHGQVMG
jgi:hypothetical protein